MISCTELDDNHALLDSAFRLLCLEPLNVVGSDIIEKEICKSYHLFANDVHGIFGTATLSERPHITLHNSLKSTLNTQDTKTYYELSLVHTTPPASLGTNHSYDQNLTTRYAWKFYNELLDFLNTKMTQDIVVVTTTEIEADNMTDFGLWSFQHVTRHNGTFQGILNLKKNSHNHPQTTPPMDPCKTVLLP